MLAWFRIGMVLDQAIFLGRYIPPFVSVLVYVLKNNIEWISVAFEYFEIVCLKGFVTSLTFISHGRRPFHYCIHKEVPYSSCFNAVI